MATRGAAPSAVCPRCGTATPPTDEPLVSCAACKLSFDPSAEPVVRPRRKEPREYAPAPPGFTIRREPGETTIRWSFERIKGIGAFLLAGLCAAVLIGNLDTPGEDWKHLALLAAGTALLGYCGLAFLFGDMVLHVDSRQVFLRREPFRLRRGIWIGRNEIQDIKVIQPSGRDTWWTISVLTPRGAIVLVTFDEDNGGAKEATTCIVETLREALDEIEAE